MLHCFGLADLMKVLSYQWQAWCLAASPVCHSSSDPKLSTADTEGLLFLPDVGAQCSSLAQKYSAGQENQRKHPGYLNRNNWPWSWNTDLSKIMTNRQLNPSSVPVVGNSNLFLGLWFCQSCVDSLIMRPHWSCNCICPALCCTLNAALSSCHFRCVPTSLSSHPVML